MNNNIFIKLNKKKYNPDIESKLNNINNERTQTNFILSKTIYNPITNIIPNQLNSQKDLVLQKDKCFNSVDIKTLINNKEVERDQQNKLYKPIKTKVINNTVQVSDNYVKSYNELKNTDLPKNETDQHNYNNILEGLKDLGIIK